MSKLNLPGMVAYIGVAIALNAVLMTRKEYNDFRGWELPAGEEGSDVGYLTQDLFGSSNTEQLDGYVQWLPKAEFERKYKLAETPKDRVLIEQTELYDRLTKLRALLEKDQPAFLDDDDWELLITQETIMSNYNDVLLRRIAKFEAKK